jgi:hypothetical protein
MITTKDALAQTTFIEYMGKEEPIGLFKNLGIEHSTYALERAELYAHSYIDAYKSGNPSRFINQSCAPNTILETHHDQKGRYRYMFVSVRPLLAGEQITCDFEDDFIQRLEKSGTQCMCMSPICRRRIPAEDFPMVVGSVLGTESTQRRDDRWLALFAIQSDIRSLSLAINVLLPEQRHSVSLFLYMVLSYITKALTLKINEALDHIHGTALQRFAPYFETYLDQTTLPSIEGNPSNSMLLLEFDSAILLLGGEFIHLPPIDPCSMVVVIAHSWALIKCPDPLPIQFVPRLWFTTEVLVKYGHDPLMMGDDYTYWDASSFLTISDALQTATDGDLNRFMTEISSQEISSAGEYAPSIILALLYVNVPRLPFVGAEVTSDYIVVTHAMYHDARMVLLNFPPPPSQSTATNFSRVLDYLDDNIAKLAPRLPKPLPEHRPTLPTFLTRLQTEIRKYV